MAAELGIVPVLSVSLRLQSNEAIVAGGEATKALGQVPSRPQFAVAIIKTACCYRCQGGTRNANSRTKSRKYQRSSLLRLELSILGALHTNPDRGSHHRRVCRDGRLRPGKQVSAPQRYCSSYFLGRGFRKGSTMAMSIVMKWRSFRVRIVRLCLRAVAAIAISANPGE